MPKRVPRAAPGPYLIHLELLRDRVPDPGRFPYSVPAIRHLDVLPFHPKVTFLVGENGSGKSTLMEGLAVACGLNPEGGSRNFNFATRESHSELNRCLRLARTPARPGDGYFLRAESFYNVATEIERLGVQDSYGGKSLHEQSHGESFFALFRHRFGGRGVYLLDEPEAALSPNRQLQFVALLHQYVKLGGQFVVATHSPIIMAYPDAWIYELSADGTRRVAYTETEHYTITRGFLASPQRMLRELMADHDPDDLPDPED